MKNRTKDIQKNEALIDKLEKEIRENAKLIQINESLNKKLQKSQELLKKCKKRFLLLSIATPIALLIIAIIASRGLKCWG